MERNSKPSNYEIENYPSIINVNESNWLAFVATLMYEMRGLSTIR